MEELIDILDDNGNLTGKIETRSNVHKKGLCHRIIVVAIITKDGKLLMQQRADNKDTDPGKWDVSAAGHVSSGQTSIEAAIREINEELGIIIDEKELNFMYSKMNKHKVNENYIANHLYDFYIIHKDNINVNNIVMQESEVKAVKLVRLKELDQMISDKCTVNRAEFFEKIKEFMN